MPLPNRQTPLGISRIQRLHRKLVELDHYALLGVPRDADVSLIQSAVALLRAQLQGLAAGAEAPGKIQDILGALDHAWSVLGDPVRRASYDRSLVVTSRAATPVAFPLSRAEHSQEMGSSPAGDSNASTPTPSAAPPRPTPRDPWVGSSLPPITADDALEAMGAALEAALTALAAQGVVDPRFEDARQTFVYVRLRRTVGLAREHEAHGRWEQASQAWARAANGCPRDAWLLAHAARTALLADPTSEEVGHLARHALAIDPENPLARRVVASIEVMVVGGRSALPVPSQGSAAAGEASSRKGDGASPARASIPPAPGALRL